MQFGTLGSAGKLNGIAHGKNGGHGGMLASLKRPKNGKAWIGIIIGGFANTKVQIADKLLDWYGIDCQTQVTAEFRKSSKIHIPRNVEVGVILTDSLPSGLLPKAIKACEEAGVPHVGITRRASTWREPLSRAGFDTPPLWRADAAIVREAASHDDEESDDHTDDAPVKTTALVATTPGKPVVIDVSSRPPLPDGKRQAVRYADLPFASALKTAREQAGLSRDELGEIVGISGAGGVTNWEQGKNLPFYRQWVKLKELFPDLPDMTGLRGEAKAIEAAAKQAAKISAAPAVPPLTSAPAEIVVPPPGPYVPPTRRDFHDDFHHNATDQVMPGTAWNPPATPAEASPASPQASPAALQQPSTPAAILQDYAAAIAEMQAADAAMAEAQARREAALVKLEAAHARIIGRGSK